MTKPLLSVMIPVYNGERYLEFLLQQWLVFSRTPAGECFFQEAEVIVAENVSTDDTRAIARRYLNRIPNFRIHEATEHLPSAEQNVFRTFKHCLGTYTWTLGVDDFPVFSAMPRLLHILRDGTYDMLVSNTATVSANVALTRASNFIQGNEVLPVTLIELAQRFGYWFVLAGMSGHVVRTASVQNYDLAGLVTKTSPIYAHVTAYIECFGKALTATLSFPLVFYSVSYAPERHDHWIKAAERAGVFQHFFWTLGYVRQIRHLQQKGIVQPGFVGDMLENNDTSFFRPLMVMAEKLFDQMRLTCSTTEKRNRLSRSDFDEVVGFILEEQPMWREFAFVLREIFDYIEKGLHAPHALWARAQSLLSTQQAAYVFSWSLVETILDYEIYRIAGCFYAVHRRFKNLLPVRLHYLGAESCPPLLFKADSLTELGAIVRDQGISKDEFDRIPEALWRFASIARTIVPAENDTNELLRYELAEARRTAAENRARLDEILNSNSWQITWPLRLARTVVRRLFGRR